MPERLFVFMQMEFPWELGPPDGRYLLRASDDGAAERVVVFGSLLASRQASARAAAAAGRPGPLRGRLAQRRERPASPEPAAVATTRVTVIDPISLSAEHQAQAWLSEMDREREIEAALAIVNRVLQAQRVSAADPHVTVIDASRALVIRAGWGEGEEVADGRWREARELPARPKGTRRRGARRDRSAALRPQERLAALLGGRSRMLMCEELALRARLDLDGGRLELAAIGLDRAYAVAPAELRAERRHDLTIRVAELEQLRPQVQEQAGVALASAGSEDPAPGAPDGEVLTHALARLEAALRARTAPGV